MARVYVSSTFEDLKDCREKVRAALQRLGHQVVAMEFYDADPRRPLEKSLKDVASCDLYIGIFALRYGCRPPGETRSFTELEYRHAHDTGKDCLIFLLDEEADWKPKWVDKGRDRSAIDALRAELSLNSTVKFFKTCDELAGQVATAVTNALRDGDDGNSEPPFDREGYCKQIRQRYGRLDLEALTPPQAEEYLQIQLRSVFIEQSVRENPPPGAGSTVEDTQRAGELYRRKPPRPVLDVLVEPANAKMVILGDPGTGKSTLARYLLLSLAEPGGDERLSARLPDHLPLLIELHRYAALRDKGKCNTFFKYLDYLVETEGFPLTTESFDVHSRQGGHALVLFDGLDEVFVPEERETISRQIISFAEKYPTARLVVTSRIIGYRHGVFTNAGFSHFTLQDLDEPHISEFLKLWYALALHDRPQEAADRRERILHTLARSPAIRQLAGNPLLLTILAILGKHQQLPRDRVKLYAHAASVLVQHWDVKRQLIDSELAALPIDEDDKQEVLRRVAYRMQTGRDGPAGNYLPREPLEFEFEAYLKERYSYGPVPASQIATAMIRQFQERSYILSHYGGDLFGFVHRAFLEYFCATHFVRRFEKTREMSIEQLEREVFDAHWQDESWDEVLRLLCGLLDVSFAGRLIHHLSSEIYRPWPATFGQRLPRNVVLAMQCLGEVRNPRAITEQGEELLRLVIELLERSVKTEEPNLDRLLEQVVSAIGVIGEGWPGRDLFLDWFDRKGSEIAHWPTSSWSARIAAVLFPSSEEVRSRLKRLAKEADDHRLRWAAIDGLLQSWAANLETRDLLKEQVADRNEEVRTAALWAFAEGWRDDPETLRQLKHWAMKGDHNDVRRAAVEAIAEGWRSDPQTLELLHERARKDPYSLVRSTAASAIVKGWPDEPRTLPLLHDLAQQDPNEHVQARAGSLASQLESRP